ncbi:glycosyltransferase [bacterium]|nr:glycosyltransferase [bacterium]MDB2675298.1 glycosyltransferase [Flavobacteriales bacterium]
MKLALIGTTFPFRGGIAAFNERLAKELMHQGHEVSIYTFTVQYPNFLFPGKTQFSTDEPPKGLHIDRCINSINPFNWVTVGNRIKKEKFDVVFIPFWLPLMGLSLGSLAKIIKKNKHSKILSIVHNIIPHESRFGDKWLTNYFTNQVDGFLAMTQNVLNDLKTFNSSKPKVLSPHPIYDNFGDLIEREKALTYLKLDTSFNYMLFFGLIRDYKGLDLVLKALSEVEDKKIKLIIAGEYYSDKTPYQNLIKELELEDRIIEVDKFIPDSEVNYYFSACDVVVQPYKSATQSGVTQIAYHFNKPMIVTDVGGLKEMCPDGKVGYVVSPEPKEIKNAILKFYESTDKEGMKESIKEEKKKYSWSKFTNVLFSLVDKVNK